MIHAHGGGKVARTQRDGGIATDMIVRDTTAHSPAAVHMKQLDYLVSNTTGVARNSAVLEGVLQDTTQGSPTGHAATSELMKSHERFATQGTFGQVPYAEAARGSSKPHILGKATKEVKRPEHEKSGLQKEEEGTKKGMMRKTARKAYEKK
jgi:hypothetical protein